VQVPPGRVSGTAQAPCAAEEARDRLCVAGGRMDWRVARRVLVQRFSEAAGEQCACSRVLLFSGAAIREF